MSTSLIYHAFGAVGYHYLKTEYRESSIFIHIEKKRKYQYCADCKSRNTIKKGCVKRELKTVPIGKKSVYLVVHLHRLYCGDCGALKLEPLFLSLPKKHWTKSLGRYVLELLRFATIEDVSKHLGMSWDTIKEIHVGALRKKVKKRKIKHLKQLGIDEIAVKKGHSYLTVVVDLDTGQVVWVAQGRKASSVEEFFKKLKQVHAPIKAIAIDMWPAYIKAVLKYYSYDVLVFDRYHIISECNKMIDELRRKEAQTVEKTDKNVFKGVRYLLLKGQEKIENDYKAKYRLQRLLEINQSLNTAYILKEELRELWHCTSLKEAEDYLDDWLKKAWASGVTLIKKFATMLASHRVGILNYFNHPITTGPVEGINNKIKVLKRKAYGYRDIEYFKMRIYFLHESRYALIG
jgi:transposase